MQARRAPHAKGFLGPTGFVSYCQIANVNFPWCLQHGLRQGRLVAARVYTTCAATNQRAVIQRGPHNA
eukprot:1315737-Lingulodinium_polyedra.AAC.1